MLHTTQVECLSVFSVSFYSIGTRKKISSIGLTHIELKDPTNGVTIKILSYPLSPPSSSCLKVFFDPVLQSIVRRCTIHVLLLRGGVPGNFPTLMERWPPVDGSRSPDTRHREKVGPCPRGGKRPDPLPPRRLQSTSWTLH